MVPLPPRRPADLGVAAPAPVTGSVTPAPAAAQQQGGDLLGEIGTFLEGLFGGAFGGGGQSQYPGYEWSALEGWVPTGGKENAGMMNAARGALAPPAAPDAPQRPVAPVAVPGSGSGLPNLPAPASGTGFGSLPIDLTGGGIPNDFTAPPTSKPGRFAR